MSFSEAVATMPDLLRLWVLWLTVVMIAAPVVLLFYREARGMGAVILAASLAVMIAMHLLYAQVGFTRLLGLPHLLIWGPLAVWLAVRLVRSDLRAVPQWAAGIFLASICISLVFDAVDVARYAAGERTPMTEATGG